MTTHDEAKQAVLDAADDLAAALKDDLFFGSNVIDLEARRRIGDVVAMTIFTEGKDFARKHIETMAATMAAARELEKAVERLQAFKS